MVGVGGDVVLVELGDGLGVDAGDALVAGADVEGGAIGADDDGVVIVPRLEAPEAALLSQARIVKEAQTRQRLKAGELGQR